MSDERLPADAQDGVEPSCGVYGQQPTRNTGGFTCQTRQPTGEDRHGVHQQRDFDAPTHSRQTVLEALSVAMRFQVAERQLDLHAARIQCDQLPRREQQRRRGNQQPRVALKTGGRKTGVRVHLI